MIFICVSVSYAQHAFVRYKCENSRDVITFRSTTMSVSCRQKNNDASTVSTRFLIYEVFYQVPKTLTSDVFWGAGIFLHLFYSVCLSFCFFFCFSTLIFGRTKTPPFFRSCTSAMAPVRSFFVDQRHLTENNLK